MKTIYYGEEVQAGAALLDEWMQQQDNPRQEMTDMDTDTTLISLPLVGGGFYTGTVDDCLQFLYKHRTMVEDSTALRTYFHYSESKEQYVYIEHMHPNYIRNVLLKGLGLQEAYLKDEAGSEYMEYILGNDKLPADLVAQAVRTWYELVANGVGAHTEALLLALEGSEYHDDVASAAELPSPLGSNGSVTTVLEGPGGRKTTITHTACGIEIDTEWSPPFDTDQVYGTSEVTGTEEYTVPGREPGPVAL